MKIHGNYIIRHLVNQFISNFHFIQKNFNRFFIMKIWFWNILPLAQKFWFMLHNQTSF